MELVLAMIFAVMAGALLGFVFGYWLHGLRHPVNEDSDFYDDADFYEVDTYF